MDEGKPLADGAERFSNAVESGVAAALVWAQNVKAAADGPERKKTPGAKNNDAMDEGEKEEEEEDELPTMVGTEDALSGALGTKRLAKVWPGRYRPPRHRACQKLPSRHRQEVWTLVSCFCLCEVSGA